MGVSYTYDHAWTDERIRLAGLEAVLDAGTREHLLRVGVRPAARCLEVGAGGGTVAFWLVSQVGPDGEVVATDLETDFLNAEASHHRGLKVLRHDITAEDLPGNFDVVHARWLVEWLPDKRQALARMAQALCPGGMLLVEEPDFVTAFGAAQPPVLRKVMLAGMRYLESTCPVEVEYGRRLVDDLDSTGLVDVGAEGRAAIVRGGSPPAAHFIRLTLEKLRAGVLATGAITQREFNDAVAALEDDTVTIMMPMTVAAWGRRD
jgi:2-polyprenyl-3-methyl-5-hydroxy-6-metoxy-1,4-benzoquinol methylase